MINSQQINENANIKIQQTPLTSRVVFHQKDQLAEMALLAEAAYADFSAGFSDDDIRKALIAKDGGTEFGEAQANLVVNNWEVLAYWDDEDSLKDSGFSGTLFKRVGGGQHVLALEGTQEIFNDGIRADINGIMSNGLAYEQILDMYNFWQQLNTPKGETYQAAILIDYDIYSNDIIKELMENLAHDPEGEDTLNGIKAELKRIQKGSNFIYDPLDLRVKEICFVDSQDAYIGSNKRTSRIYGLELNPASVTIVGHSLGGHLAMAFSRLFASASDSVYMFNGAGFGDGFVIDPSGTSRNNITNVFVTLNGKNSFDADKIINFVGNKNIDFVAQDWQGIGLSQKGKKLDVFIENGNLSSVFGHGMGQLTNSLAVIDLFHRLGIKSDTFEELLSTSNSLLTAIQRQRPSALEAVITMLAKIFYSQEDYDNEINGVELDRPKMYSAIVKLHAIIAETGNQFTNELTPLIGKTADSKGALLDKITSYNDSAIGYRFAMVNLMPFAVIGPDYQQLNQHGLLNIYNPDEKNKHFGFTERYLRDRFDMVRTMWTWADEGLQFSDLKTGITVGTEIQQDVAIEHIFYPHEKEYVKEHNEIDEQTKSYLNIYGGTTTSIISLSGTSGYVEQINHQPLTSRELNVLNIEQGHYEVFDPSTMLYLQWENVGFDLRKYSGSNSGILGNYAIGYDYIGAFVTSGKNGTVNVKITIANEQASVTFKNVPYITCTVGEAEEWIGGPGEPMPFTFWFQQDTADKNSTAYILTRGYDPKASLVKNNPIKMRECLEMAESKTQAQNVEGASIKGTNEDDVLTINGESLTVAGLLGDDTYIVTLKDGNRVTLVETGLHDYDKIILTNLAFDEADFIYTDSGLEIQSELGTVILSSGSINLFEELVFTDKTLYQEDIEQLIATAVQSYPGPEAIGSLNDFYVKPQSPFEWTLPEDSFKNIESVPTYYFAIQSDFQRLPEWLTFDPFSGQLTGLAPAEEQNLYLIVFAVSVLDKVASHRFSFRVSNATPASH